MKTFGKIIITIVGVLSFSFPAVMHAQTIDVYTWNMLQETHDRLVALYNLTDNIQNGIVVEPVMYDTDMATPSCTVLSLYRDLSLGATGSDVQALQQFLRNEGYFNASLTGYYGSVTARAVQDWKSTHGITYSSARSAKEYGVVDQIMRAMLQKSC